MEIHEDQRIQSYSMAELSQLYSPSLSVSAASKQLLRWMGRHPNLITRLKEAGWQKGQRRFSPKQISVLFDCLGAP